MVYVGLHERVDPFLAQQQTQVAAKICPGTRMRMCIVSVQLLCAQFNIDRHTHTGPAMRFRDLRPSQQLQTNVVHGSRKGRPVPRSELPLELSAHFCDSLWQAAVSARCAVDRGPASHAIDGCVRLHACRTARTTASSALVECYTTAARATPCPWQSGQQESISLATEVCWKFALRTIRSGSSTRRCSG